MTQRVPAAVWVSSFEAGGTERQMVELIHALKDEFEVHALCFRPQGPWLSRAATAAASIRDFPISGFGKPSTLRQVRRYSRWCREHGIQIVLTSDFYTNVFGLTGAALARVPVRIGGRREINTDKTAAKLLLQRGAYALAHRVVANSRAAAARLSSEGVRSTVVAVVPNGIDTAAFDSAREVRPIRRAVTVANLRAEKGHDVLIEAIAADRGRLSAIEFQFVGDGPCRASLERLVEERGLQNCVRFLGERHDVAQLLAEADLFVLPSRTEAFPNSVMEAMAAGLPVIACSVGGLLELVEDGVSGVLVPPDDASALAQAIGGLIQDPERARRLGREARALVQARYSIRQMAAGFADLFATELRRRSPGKLERSAAPLATG